MLPKNFGGPPPQIWGAKTSNFGPLLRDFFTRHRISPKRNVAATTKMLSSIYNVSPKVDLLSVTFDTETAEIRSVIVTHPYLFFIVPLLS